MDINVDATVGGRGPPHPRDVNLKVRTHPRIAALKGDVDCQISPHSPLVSTELDENGWVCGDNSCGQLGVGPGAQEVHEPQPLKVARRWACLAMGASHTAAVTGQGEVYTWGLNDCAQLGMSSGRGPAVDTPRRMELLVGWNVRGMACGAAHTVAFTMQDVITWGANDRGQCGHGERAEPDWVKPRSIKMLHDLMITQVVCGAAHTLCVTGTSQVYAWGANSRGQLGLGDVADRRTPTLVDGLWALPVLQLGAGDSHSAALTNNGFLFTWGANCQGQLGLPAAAEVAAAAAMHRSASERRRVNRRVNQRFLTAMLEMEIPQDRAELALHETGNVGVEVAAEWLFSVPDDVLETHLAADPGTPVEELGEAHPDRDVLVPKRVALSGVHGVACGAAHTVAHTADEVYAWGAGGAGQLGLGPHVLSSTLPVAVASLAGAGVRCVAAGAAHTLFVTADGGVLGCGDASYGALPLADEAAGGSCARGGRPPRAGSRLAGGPVPAAGGPRPHRPAGHPFAAGGSACPAEPMDCDGEPHGAGPEDGLEGEAPRPASARHQPPLGGGWCVYHPAPLRLAFLGQGRAGAVVSAAVAAPHASAFLTRGRDEPAPRPPSRLWERLEAAVAAARDAPREEHDARVKPIAIAVERIFGSPAAICAAFGLRDRVGLDAALLDSVAQGIADLEAASRGEAGAAGPPAAGPAPPGQAVPPTTWLFNGMHRGMEVLLSELERNSRLLGTPERAQVLLAACQSLLLGDPRCSQSLVPRLCGVVLAAPATTRHLLVKWWAECPAALLEARVVRPLQRYLTDELYTTKKLTVSVMNVIKVLARVEEGSAAGRVLPPDAFYNELISEKLDVLDHYVAWRQTHDTPAHAPGADGPFSFCSYPFLLNPRAKSKLLHTEARIQMDQTVAACRAEAAAGGEAAGGEERVVPAKRRAPRDAAAAARGAAAGGAARRDAGDGSSSARGAARAGDGELSARRRDRGPGGLRWLFNTLRSGDGAAAGSSAAPGPATSSHTAAAAAAPVAGELTGVEDERRTIARQASDGSSSLWKQGSLNLPAPEDSGFPGTHPDMCIVRIRRNHLLEDALDEIARQKPKDLFKPLRVHFIGEDGIDAGGVKKEFFQLLVAEVLSPDYGMLSYQPESRTYWFCPVTLEGEGAFLLLGLVLGLAIYNGVLLDFPLPLALYRKILGQEVRLRDLEDMQPSLGKGLRALLQYEPPVEEVVECEAMQVEVGVGGGDDAMEVDAATSSRHAASRVDGAATTRATGAPAARPAPTPCALPGHSVEEVFCQSFVVEVAGWGERRAVELKPGGAGIPVTEDSRREFVDAYVDFWLNTSVHAQFEAFARGFLMLCGGPALQLFSATELERLVCGNPCLDFEGLQRSARYEGGYSADHRVVQWLWDVVGELDADERRLFLKFFTGSDRAPIGGLANLRCVIQRDGADSNKLPTSHTCFNTLLLPSYRSREKLADRLKLAILNSEGFGLE
ncbi:hypothetical protein ACKKBG_A25530 [Auxenochlorella protothecoides x Auxenochlorella symbiontica]